MRVREWQNDSRVGWRRSGRCLRIALLVGALLSGTNTRADTAAPDRSWRDASPSQAIRPAEYGGVQRRSGYVRTRDGVQLAADVWLPVELQPGTRLPAILEQTRYYRSALLKADPHGACRPAGKPTIDLFVTHGYAYVVLDVRGTGASFGTRAAEYSDDEVADGRDVLDWIVRQEWSDGKVGSQGQSYLGTAAELQLRNRHPALRAIAPSFSGYDFYSEIARPGGIENSAFGNAWSELIAALDHGTPPESSPVLGPCPVDEDKDRSMLRSAIAQHAANFNFSRFMRNVSFRDDRFEGLTAGGFGPVNYQQAIDAARVPVYAIAGWYDSGYALGAIRRYLSSSSPDMRVLIGPWGHGARYFYAPGIRAPTASSFDLAAEKLRYFDYELKGIGAGFPSLRSIRYFTTGSNQWHHTARWPPPGSHLRPWYFGNNRSLVGARPGREEADEHADDGTAGSGDDNRWHSTTGAYPVAYPDRATVDQRLQTYTSAPLQADLEVTGSPVVTLFLSTDRTDTGVFAYLEEVTADGQVNYVTEGELLASRRRTGTLPFRSPAPVHTDRRRDFTRVTPLQSMQLDIGLLPLSHVFSAGSRLRIALTSSDRSQFREQPMESQSWKILRGGARASRIDLPIIDRRVAP